MRTTPEEREKRGKMKNDITLNLFHPDPGSGKIQVALTDDFGKAAMISAALAIRQANLPYTPVLDGGGPNIPHADVEFTVDHPEEQIAVQRTIRAKMVFPKNPEMRAQYLSPDILIGGTNEDDPHIRYTPAFHMDHSDLAELLYDAYYDGSVNEDAFYEQADLKYEQVLFQERMEHLATLILDGRNRAFEHSLSYHLGRFDPGAIGYPESRVETASGDRHGTITAVFEPAAPGGGDRGAEGR